MSIFSTSAIYMLSTNSRFYYITRYNLLTFPPSTVFSIILYYIVWQLLLVLHSRIKSYNLHSRCQLSVGLENSSSEWGTLQPPLSGWKKATWKGCKRVNVYLNLSCIVQETLLGATWQICFSFKIKIKVYFNIVQWVSRPVRILQHGWVNMQHVRLGQL